MTLSAFDLTAAGIAAFAAGAVNALAGGGTLVSFPVLVAIGIPALPANITNTSRDLFQIVGLAFQASC